MQSIKTVAVVGAGAIGGWLAGRLDSDADRSGIALFGIARGSTIQTLQTSGLRLLSNSKHHILKTQWQTAEFYKNSSQKFDLIVVAVKSQGMAQVARDIAPLMHENTIVLTAMNGVPWWFLAEHPLQSVDPNGEIAAVIQPGRVIGCVVHASCSTESPGVVRHHFGNGLILGEAQRGPSPRLAEVVDLFKSAGLDASASDFIQRDIWFKLWGNMTMNPISALTGATTDEVLADPHVRGFVSEVMLEAKKIGECIGIPILQSPEDRHAVTLKLGAFKTSMLQDVMAGRGIELDALVGAVHELGERVGVPMPHTSALLGLTRLMARQRGLYPS